MPGLLQPSTVPPTGSAATPPRLRAHAVRAFALSLAFLAASSFAQNAPQRASISLLLTQPGAATHLSRGSTDFYRSHDTAAPLESAAPTLQSGGVAPASSSAASAGLIINAAFDPSITNSPHAAAIESMINRAIGRFQSLFSDQITVSILFRYSKTQPNGSPFPAHQVASSAYVFYKIPWDTYRQALAADAKTANDSTANASLPPTPLSTNVLPSSAAGRAIGLDTRPAMFANGSVAVGGTYDGIVTINAAAPVQFTRPINGSSFDALTFTEHEIDEVLGLGSFINGSTSDIRPQDLFSWSSPGTRNLSASGRRYFSIDGGNSVIADFNQDSNGDFGDWFSPPCPQSNPLVQNAIGCPGEGPDISVTSPEGINLDVIGYDLVGAPPPPTPTPTPTATPGSTPSAGTRMANISTRLSVGTGANALIGGFILRGSTPEKIIVRAIGPSLPVTGALLNPLLDLHDARGATIASNDNWTDSPDHDAIVASGVSPTNPAESAIVATLKPGNTTAVVSGVNGTTGIGLVEIYDMGSTTDTRLVNISTRGFVQTGDNLLIAGVIITGDGPLRILFRALGPSLGGAGISNFLPDPTLELHDRNGTVIDSNNNWRSDHEAEIMATTLPPPSEAESAIVRSLSPGNYTAILRGVGNTTGVALVEAYQIN
jgi:hypothetical protein